MALSSSSQLSVLHSFRIHLYLFLVLRLHDITFYDFVPLNEPLERHLRLHLFLSLVHFVRIKENIKAQLS